jgi:hypothetical protein
MRDEVTRLEGALDAERHRRQLAEARARCYLDELDARDGLRCHAEQVNGPRLIPCPVCGQELRYGAWPLLEGEGLTEVMVDCPDRHHATTDPHEWERLRVEALIRTYRGAVEDG